MNELAVAKPRRKSELTLRLEAGADAQTMKVVCGVDGCGWEGFTGPAGEAREEARQHRQANHPDRPVVATRPRKKKPPRREQTAEDKAILRTLAVRAQKKRGRPRASSNPRPQPETKKLKAGESLICGGCGKPISLPLNPGDLFYCSQSRKAVPVKVQKAPRRFHSRGGNWTRGPARKGGQPPGDGSFINPEREEAAWKLYAAGCSVSQIAHLAWEPWGYKSPKTCYEKIILRFRVSGRTFRPRLAFGTQIPEVSRSEAAAILKAAG